MSLRLNQNLPKKGKVKWAQLRRWLVFWFYGISNFDWTSVWQIVATVPSFYRFIKQLPDCRRAKDAKLEKGQEDQWGMLLVLTWSTWCRRLSRSSTRVVLNDCSFVISRKMAIVPTHLTSILAPFISLNRHGSHSRHSRPRWSLDVRSMLFYPLIVAYS